TIPVPLLPQSTEGDLGPKSLGLPWGGQRLTPFHSVEVELAKFTLIRGFSTSLAGHFAIRTALLALLFGDKNFAFFRGKASTIFNYFLEASIEDRNPMGHSPVTHLREYLAYWLASFAVSYGDNKVLR